jgi:hypothetical protein
MTEWRVEHKAIVLLETLGKFMAAVDDDGGRQIKCALCGYIVSVDVDTDEYSMTKHLVSNHPKEFIPAMDELERLGIVSKKT